MNNSKKKKSSTKKSLPIIAASVASVSVAVASAVNVSNVDTPLVEPAPQISENNEKTEAPTPPEISYEDSLVMTAASVDQEFTIDHLTYKVTNASTNEVEVKSNSTSISGSISIPRTVNYSSETFTITSIGKSAFEGCSLTSINIPNSVTSIGEQAFHGCTNLTSINIPNSVTSISNLAFSGSGLKNITIPDNVTFLGEFSFANCPELTDATIGSNIGGAAFQDCPKLANVIIKEGVENIGDAAFSAIDSGITSSLKSVTIPSTIKTIGSHAFYNCTKLESSITIPEGVKTIESYTFSGCVKLPEIILPESLESIRTEAFNNCSALKNIKIPNNVTTIELMAFGSCTGLTDITFGDKVETIGSMAFSFCTELTDITLGKSVKTIESSAFSLCTNLKSVKIPESVTSIGENAFQNCEKLKYILFEGKTIDEIKLNEFDNYGPLSGTPIANGEAGSAVYVYKALKDNSQFRNLGIPEDKVYIIPEEAPTIQNLNKGIEEGYPSLSWSASENAQTYKITRKKDDESEIKELERASVDTSFTDYAASSEITESGNYVYSITPYTYYNFNAEEDDPYGNEKLVGDTVSISIYYGNINKSSYDNGEISFNKSKAFEGEEITLTLNPNEHYNIKPDSLEVQTASGTKISTKDISNRQYTFTMPAEDVTVSAEFVAKEYNINIKSYQRGKITSDNLKSIKDQTVKLEVTPYKYYTLKSNSLEVQTASGTKIPTVEIGSGEYTFTMPGEDVTVSAEFVDKEYNVNIGSFQHGEVTLENSSKYTYNQTVTLNVIPEELYVLKSDSLIVMTDSGKEIIPISVGNGKYTFKMPQENVNVLAEFVDNEFNVNIESFSNGTVNIDKVQQKESELVKLTVNAEENYILSPDPDGLIVRTANGTTIPIQNIGNGEYTFIMPGENVYVAAKFVEAFPALKVEDPTTGLIIEAERGTLPYRAYVVVSEVDEDHANYGVVWENLDEDIKEIVERSKFYSIEIHDRNGQKIQPQKGHKVKISIPVPNDYDISDLHALRVEAGEDVDYEAKVENIEDKNYFVFETDHFSHYGMIDKDLNEISIPNNGSYENGSIVVDKNGAAKGENVTVTITPKEGYILEPGSLTVNGSSGNITDNGDGTYTFPMPDENIKIDAKFIEAFPALKVEDPTTGLIIETEKGALPYGAYVVVSEVNKDHANYGMVWKNLDENIKKIVERSKFYSIEIHDRNGQKIQPKNGYKVKISIPLPDEYDVNDLQALRIESGDDVNYSSTIETKNGKKYIVFETDHFSYYGIIDKDMNKINSDNSTNINNNDNNTNTNNNINSDINSNNNNKNDNNSLPPSAETSYNTSDGRYNSMIISIFSSIASGAGILLSKWKRFRKKK